MRQKLRAWPAAMMLAFVIAGPASAAELVPMGTAVGVRLFSDGIMVVGTAQVESDTGSRSPADEGGLEKGDIITRVNDEEVTSAQEFRELVLASGGEDLAVTATRDGETLELELTPVMSDGAYKLGIWIRDSLAGIGTMTYYDPASGRFGALGHGVNDVDTGQLLPLMEGAVMDTQVASVKKGKAGAPGQLEGDFDVIKDIGTVDANTNGGIFGQLRDVTEVTEQALETADKSQVKNGPAYILSNVEGDKVEKFQVEIVKQLPLADDGYRNMVVKVTDQRLLELTGGIVQGMSGSPIIQEGKIIGAVTHVLVNDPTKGYGIYIENMLSQDKNGNFIDRRQNLTNFSG